MKITKLGHCALVLEANGKKILTDPGNFTADAQKEITGIDILLITHEHQDHFHTDSVQALVEKNPDMVIVTNASVGMKLTELGLSFIVLGEGDMQEIKGTKIEGFGHEHAPIYETMGLVENTGYLLNDSFYFPGDNFCKPRGKQVDILALPVAGPWMKMSEAVTFAKEIKARVAFGVHDAMVQPFFRGFIGNLLKTFVPETVYVSLSDGEAMEF